MINNVFLMDCGNIVEISMQTIDDVNYCLKNISFSIFTNKSGRLSNLSIKSTLATVAGIYKQTLTQLHFLKM